MRRPAFLLLDLVLVLVFAALGRRSHAETGALTAVLGTAWPFLVGTLAGWAVSLAARHDPTTLRGGWPVWLGAVVVGMALRAATGAGTALPFVLVTLVALAAFLLLPRLVAARTGRRTGAGRTGRA